MPDAVFCILQLRSFPDIADHRRHNHRYRLLCHSLQLHLWAGCFPLHGILSRSVKITIFVTKMQ